MKKMNFFGTAPTKNNGRKDKDDPKEQAREWKRKLNKEIRSLDRDITSLKRAEDKAVAECKKLASTGNVKAAKILAKEIVNTRKSAERMHAAKAQLNSVQMQLQTTVSMLKVQGIMGKSVEIMQVMNQLVNIPELSATMRDMAKEMERAGLIDELIGETMESLDAEGVDTQADAQVDQVLRELTQGILDGASAAPTAAVPKKAAPAAAASSTLPVAPQEGEMVDDSDEISEMRARLQEL